MRAHFCRGCIGDKKGFTVAQGKVAVELCQDASARGQLLQSLQEAQDAPTCNSLLSCCSSASSARLAAGLLQLMAASHLPLDPHACAALLLQSCHQQLHLDVISWYLGSNPADSSSSSSSINSSNSSNLLQNRVRRLPAACIQAAAVALSSSGQTVNMLSLLAACEAEALKGRLLPLVAALATETEFLARSDVAEALMGLGLASGDNDFVAWQARYILAVRSEVQLPPDMLQPVVLQLLPGSESATAAALLRCHGSSSTSCGVGVKRQASQGAGLQWRVIAEAAIAQLGVSKGDDAAGSLEVVQLCLRHGTGLMELQGRTACAAAKAGLWTDALQLLEVARRGPAQAQEQLLLGLVGLEGAAAITPESRLFLVRLSKHPPWQL